MTSNGNIPGALRGHSAVMDFQQGMWVFGGLGSGPEHRFAGLELTIRLEVAAAEVITSSSTCIWRFLSGGTADEMTFGSFCMTFDMDSSNLERCSGNLEMLQVNLMFGDL